MTDDGARGSSTGATCLLLVGDRVLLRATAPPDAEYAMFEIGEIELRASEPGRVREHGYQTTVGNARARLANLGITSSLARDFADAMQPTLSDAYARGRAVRRVARYLGPVELFQSETYDPAEQVYRGVFLDLAAMSRDLGLEHTSTTLHALYLATILELESKDTTVLLSTDACTKGGKPGARTHKRPTFTDPKRLLNALGGLSHKAPKPDIADPLPRADVIAFLRSRADSAPDEDARALYKSLESSVSLRDMPERGPLAAADLWAIETRIESGDLDGTLDAIDDAERRHGRTPGTTYLRARVSLALRLEPAKLIAERVSALALSMTSFREIALLAAEAWVDAGDARRAMPYARDLIDSPDVDEGLLLRAQRLLARAVGAAPQKKQTLVDSIPAPQPSRPPAMLEPAESLDFGAFMDPGELEFESSRAPAPLVQSDAPETADKLGSVRTPELEAMPESLEPEDLVPLSDPLTPSIPSLSPRPPPSRPSRQAPPPVPSRLPPPQMPSSRRLPAAAPVPALGPPSTRDESALTRALRSKRPAAADVMPSAPPPLLDLDLATSDPAASFTLDLPGPAPAAAEPDQAGFATLETPPAPVVADAPRPSRRPRLSGVMLETRPPASSDPRAEPDSPIIPRSTPLTASEFRSAPAPEVRQGPAPARRASGLVAPPVAHERPTPLRPPSGPEVLSSLVGAAPSVAARASGSVKTASTPASTEPSFMHGASLPPYRHEDPAPPLPKAPLLPKLGGAGDELAEHLALPPGLGGEECPLDVLPTSVLEARVQFTLLARELGLDYRLKRAIDLRADLTGIEAMQSVLLESFPDHVAKTTEDAYELRRHGALLSEILARRLDGEWLDISPKELGYWVMIIPPDTRVWPFGRVARLVAMGHKERDLVSYFLELQSRTRSP